MLFLMVFCKLLTLQTVPKSTLIEAKRDEQVIYIDYTNGYRQDCGKWLKPCVGVNSFVKEQIHKSIKDVTLKIKAAYTRTFPSVKKHKYTFAEFAFGKTNISISVESWGKEKPLINLGDSKYMFKIDLQSPKLLQRVTLSDLDINGPLFLLEHKNVMINIKSCHIHDTSDYLIKAKEKTKVILTINKVTCTNCKGIFSFDSLDDTSVITVDDSNFISTNRRAKNDGIIIKKSNNIINVRIRNTQFKNLKNPISIRKNDQCVNITKFELKNCVVKGCDNPVNISGCFVPNIRNSLFEKNNNGAFYSEKTNTVLFNNNTFVNNKGEGAVSVVKTGLNKDGTSTESGRHVFVNDSLFINNTRKKEGGAIYAFESHLVVKFSSFENNSAAESGGTIHHLSEKCKNCSVKMNNVSMISAFDALSKEGTLVYSNRLIVQVNMTAKVRYSREYNAHTSISAMKSDYSMSLQYKGNSSFRFECPMHFIPSTSLTKAKTEGKETLEGKIDGVEKIECNVCPKSNYNVKPVILSSMTPKTKGSCIACPDGGNCTSGIQSLDNYWGHDESGSIEFTTCPYGYCCSGTEDKCTGITTCAANREGKLCGSCKKNYTLSFHRNDCVKQGTCNRWIFWITNTVMLLAGIYFVYNHQRLIIPTIDALLKILPRKCSQSSQHNANTIEGQFNPRVYTEAPRSTLPPSPNAESPLSALLSLEKSTPLVYTGVASSSQAIIPSRSPPVDLLTSQNEVSLIKMGEINQPVDLLGISLSDLAGQHNSSLQNNIFSDSEEVLFNAADQILGKIGDSYDSQLYHHDHIEENSSEKTGIFESVDIGNVGQETSPELNFEVFFDKSIGRKSTDTCRDETSNEKPLTPAKTETDQCVDSSSDDVSMIDVEMNNELTMSVSELESLNFVNGMMQLLFFYYQCLPLVKMYDSDKYTQGFINNIFRFQLSVYGTCPFEEINQNTKDSFSFVYLLLHPVLPAVYCVSSSFLKFLTDKEVLIKPQYKKLAINIFILTYIPLASLALSMVTCVTIKGESHYYFDASKKCYTDGQWLMILFIVYWIAPLPLAFYGACKMVQEHLIPMKQFYTILLCPWFCIYSYIIVRKRKFQKLEFTRNQVQEMSIILRGVFGPFSKATDIEGAYNGISVHLARGFLLALIIPLTRSHQVIRLSLTVLIMAASLFHQRRYKPYTIDSLNRTALGSLTVLSLINIANFMDAFKYTYAVNQSAFLGTLWKILNFCQIVSTLLPGISMILLYAVSIIRSLNPSIMKLIKQLKTTPPAPPAIESGNASDIIAV